MDKFMDVVDIADSNIYAVNSEHLEEVLTNDKLTETQRKILEALKKEADARGGFLTCRCLGSQELAAKTLQTSNLSVIKFLEDIK